jgi:DNA (cytosine-5)-methyltransferase 1
MNHIDLFSGIGGFALAAHWAGFQTEVFCERDEFCQKVLHKHWPAAPIVDDIFRFDGTRHAGATLLTGGFPCQPYSCAGKKMGNEDDRALWPEMFRVIIECRPHWVVAENVLGIVDMALDGVLSDLEEEGYEVGTLVIPACAVNAPHRRDRVWIVAHHARQNDWEYHGEPGKRQIQQSGISHGENVVANPKSVGSESPRTEKPESQGAERADGGRTFVANPDSQPKNRPAIARRQCRRGQLEPGLGGMAHGLPGRMDGHFDEEPNIPRIATGIPDRAARLRALGNSIVPQVAYQIISNISKLEKSP